MNWIELVGYVASAFVVLSFAMSSIVKIRTISLVGSVFYVAYGVLVLGGIVAPRAAAKD